MKKIIFVFRSCFLIFLVLSLSSCARTNDGQFEKPGIIKIVENTTNKIQSKLAPFNKGSDTEGESQVSQKYSADDSEYAVKKIVAEKKKVLISNKATASKEKTLVKVADDSAAGKEKKVKKKVAKKGGIIAEGLSEDSPGIAGWYMRQVYNSPLSPMRRGGPGLPSPVKQAMQAQEETEE